MTDNGALIQIDRLSKIFPVSSGVFGRSSSFIHAVDDISFQIPAGKSLGLVGESGCGKTTTGKMLARLVNPTKGKILLNDFDNGPVDVAELKGKGLKAFRRRVQIIFQDPYESLNPRRTIFDTVVEPLKVQKVGGVFEREARVSDMLEKVGLIPASSFLFRYPHELSGGQRQRVAIARALIVEPNFIVADEPTSMLDVSIRIDIMKLMTDLAEQMNVSYLYITHDLAVARYMCQEIAVMYLGKIVEQAETEELIKNPLHPYTRALFSAVPIPNPRVQREAIEIKGGLSAAIDPPNHCRFYNRCPIADDSCKGNEHPPLEDKGGDHRVACYKVEG